jgi:carbonic anhydrase
MSGPTRVTYDGAGPTPSRLTAAAALAELRAGNHRFVTGAPIHPNQDAGRRFALADAQAPFCVIFGCSDSRLAAEIIFDRGLGDLFVVRTAGHVIGAEVLGSIDYAITVLDVPLVVVLGHSSCGAVQSAWDTLNGGMQPSGHLRAVVDAILPSVRSARNQGVHDVDWVVDVHVRRTVDRLLHELTPAAAGRCAVVGMSYDLRVGQVRVLAGEELDVSR